MAKKFGKFLAFTAVLGAAAAAAYYYLQGKDFGPADLEDEDDDFDDFTDLMDEEIPSRSYVTLHPEKSAEKDSAPQEDSAPLFEETEEAKDEEGFTPLAETIAARETKETVEDFFDEDDEEEELE